MFPQANDDKLCNYYVYEKVTESNIGKASVPVEYLWTGRVGECKPVKYLVQTILENGTKCLKYLSDVDNCKTVLPLMKKNYSGKFIELNLFQNLSLRAKDEVQSAHFSRKQFTLHCAIVEPVENWNH